VRAVGVKLIGVHFTTSTTSDEIFCTFLPLSLTGISGQRFDVKLTTPPARSSSVGCWHRAEEPGLSRWRGEGFVVVVIVVKTFFILGVWLTVRDDNDRHAQSL
jgi:hypothetical protein